MDEIVTNLGWQAGKHQHNGARGDRAGKTLPQDRSAGAAQNNRSQSKQRQALRRKLLAFGKRRNEAQQSAVAGMTDQTPASASPPQWINSRPPASAHPPDWNRPRQIEKPRKPRRKPATSIAAAVLASAIAGSALFAIGYQGSRLVNSYMEINAAESALALAKSPGHEASTTPVPSRSRLAELSPAETSPRTIVAAPSVPAALFDTAQTTAPLSSTAPLSAASPAAVAVIVPEAPAATTDPALVRATRLMADGHKLLATGDVMGARNLFTTSLQLGLPEAALALGRAHDPEYLALIPNANASPSVSVASAMYRQWYRKSVAAGSIAEGVQLDRLLHSMNKQ